MQLSLEMCSSPSEIRTSESGHMGAPPSLLNILLLIDLPNVRRIRLTEGSLRAEPRAELRSSFVTLGVSTKTQRGGERRVSSAQDFDAHLSFNSLDKSTNFLNPNV